MVKNIKIEKLKSKLSRDIIANFGNSVYNFNEVRSVYITVRFKDGSTIGFDRSELSDSRENSIEKEEDEDEE